MSTWLVIVCAFAGWVALLGVVIAVLHSGAAEDEARERAFAQWQWNERKRERTRGV